MNKIKYNLAFWWHSLKDYSTNRKLVVIESDDWGSIRMPSKEVFDELITLGYPLNKRPFERFDSILTNDDLNELYKVLNNYFDKNGKNPVITVNVIMANPDFLKIRELGYKEYRYETFLDTIDKYSNIDFSSWQYGIEKKLIFPQLHGREHLNVASWMHQLNIINSQEKEVFKFGLMGIPLKENPSLGNQHQIAFNYQNADALNFIKASISDATDMFKNVFGTYSKSFIAPVYTWDSEIESHLVKNNIEIMQGGRFQFLPRSEVKVKHFSGEKNKNNNLTYLVRNSFFEPSTNIDYNRRPIALNSLINQTKLAFSLNKPLIISTHRINFCGRIEEKNRDVNLDLLSKYLKWLTSSYNDVEFINTVELYNIINNKDN